MTSAGLPRTAETRASSQRGRPSMSSTFSELVADLLLDHCGKATSTEKFLIQDILGTGPVELYEAVALRATTETDIRTGPGKQAVWRMRAVELPNRVKVIPYLVREDDRGHEDTNRGNRGFNGRLRDWLGANADGEVRV